MKEAILKGDEIFQLIPQRPPIVMLDKFYGIEDELSYSGLTVLEGNIFYQSGYLAETGVIEHIAQSAAARVGFIYTRKGELVPLGLIGSIDKLKIYALPKLGDELYTEIKIIQEVGDITLIAAKTTVGETLIAECRMKIFLKTEETGNK